jgi:lipopolysaccharide/colanic/teichoic acid biosynthesis glycosyltransferase
MTGAPQPTPPPSPSSPAHADPARAAQRRGLLEAIGDGLSEDNHPPSDEIRREVLAAHRAYPPQRISFAKRAFDVSLALFGIVLSSPIWILFSLLIWLEDPGPLLFVKNSVGRGGANFRQFKFRSMVREAEKGTGPVLAEQTDTRVLRIGKLMRKTALDELPQLLNILKGEMSFVGPRPQRTVLVRDYLLEMPEYAERHVVPPGIAGLAQVAASYYITPRQKLRFDRLYVRHAGLGFDLRLLAIAFLLVFYLRWKPGWDGRVPREWLRGRRA